MVKHLVRSVPLTDAHLRASVAAVIGIDSHQFQSIGTDELHLYLERLMTNALKDFILTGSNAFSGNRSFASSDTQSSLCMTSVEGSFTKSAVQGLGRRQLEVSCISAAETGLDALSNMITKSNMIHDHGTTLWKEWHKQQPPQRLTTFMWVVVLWIDPTGDDIYAPYSCSSNLVLDFCACLLVLVFKTSLPFLYDWYSCSYLHRSF